MPEKGLPNTEFVLPPLPFAMDALQPAISKETIEFHYGKHHKGYIEKLNALLSRSNLKATSLEEIIQNSEGSLFNNAAQAWNHHFFWQCLTPEQELAPSENLKKQIENNFESLENFQRIFSETAIDGFASGWTWLERDSSSKLHIRWRPNAETPIKTGATVPLLVCDLWEHAYYIDYRNDRKKFVHQFWKIVDWTFVSQRFDASDILHFPLPHAA
jgi:Fe-Mn family superoxide dismutase